MYTTIRYYILVCGAGSFRIGGIVGANVVLATRGSRPREGVVRKVDNRSEKPSERGAHDFPGRFVHAIYTKCNIKYYMYRVPVSSEIGLQTRRSGDDGGGGGGSSSVSRLNTIKTVGRLLLMFVPF